MWSCRSDGTPAAPSSRRGTRKFRRGDPEDAEHRSEREDTTGTFDGAQHVLTGLALGKPLSVELGAHSTDHGQEKADNRGENTNPWPELQHLCLQFDLLLAEHLVGHHASGLIAKPAGSGRAQDAEFRRDRHVAGRADEVSQVASSWTQFRWIRLQALARGS